MTNYYKHFGVLIILNIFCLQTIATENVVSLDAEEIIKLKIPQNNIDFNRDDNTKTGFMLKEKEESPNFFDDEEIFESKIGKKFNRFINEKAINNKLNQTFWDMEEKYLYKENSTDYMAK